MVVHWLRLCTPNTGRPSLTAGQGAISYMPQLKITHATAKILSATTKTWHSQITECPQRVSPGSPAIRLQAPITGVPDSVLGWGTRSHMLLHGATKKKKKNCFKKYSQYCDMPGVSRSNHQARIHTGDERMKPSRNSCHLPQEGNCIYDMDLFLNWLILKKNFISKQQDLSLAFLLILKAPFSAEKLT